MIYVPRGDTDFQLQETSYHALIEHGIGDFYESGDVRANYEIAGLSVIFRSLPGVLKIVDMMWRTVNRPPRVAMANA